MKKDISGRRDIELLIDNFYEKVRADSTLSEFFHDVAWDKHLAVMYAFWENALFFTGGYSGNPMETHRRIHQRHPLKRRDFNRWLALFSETLDEMYSGEIAELARKRAASIAEIMQKKILTGST